MSMAASAGMIILGGGLIKHHICNACLMRNVLIMPFISTLDKNLMDLMLVLDQMKLFHGENKG